MAINYDAAKGGYTDGATTWSPNSDGDYEIGSLDQLKFFRDAVNDGNTFAGQTVLLTASIDLNNEEWTPIGKSGKTFQGTFDGQGNTVSNLYIYTPTQDDVGFFGFTTNGEIKNLTIENANVTGYLDVGAVAGTPYTSKYTNITLKGEVKVQGFAYVGGMFGKNVYADLTKLTIDAAEGSYVTADSGAYRTYVGGVIGFMGEGNTIVKNVTSNINVSGSTCDVGGITGIAHYGNSFVNVTCTADEVVLTDAEAGLEHEVGGIAGVWYNQANTTVQFINCNVENTTAVKSILNGVEQDVSSNITSGKSYNAETATSGSQLIGQNVVIEADGKYSAGEFTVSGPNAINVLNGKLSDGLTVYPSADGTLSVDEAGDVAMIGENRYKSLAEAVNVVQPGETITILTDITKETVSMNGFGIASWNNSTLKATGNITATAGDNVLSGNVESAQLMLTGSKEEDRTLTITESANVDLDTDGALDGGLLDVGKGLSDDKLVIIGDRGPRNYYAHVLVAGDVSVKRYKSDGNAEYGAIYIRPYSELVVTGKLDVVGEVHNRGSLVVDRGTMTMSKWLTPKLLGYDTGDSMTVTNGGLMEIYDAGAVTFGEASASLQHMEVVAQYADGMFATISAGGQFVADTLAFANDDDVKLTVTGEGSLFKLYSADGRTAASGYTYAQNEGTIIIKDNAVFDVSGLANDNFVNTGTIDISSATATFATLTNDGTVNVTGAVNVDAEFMAAGTGLLNLNSVAFGSGTSVNDTASYTNNTIGSEIVMTGTNTLTDGAFVSTGWQKNLKIGYGTGTDSDSVSVSGGATLKVGGAAYVGSSSEDKDDGAFQVNVSGTGSLFAGSGYDGSLYLRADGAINVSDQGTASFSYTHLKGAVDVEAATFSAINAVITATGGVTLSSDALFSVEHEITLGGAVSMDYTSTVAFETITDDGGSLTIDMEGFSGGVYKLLDYTGDASYSFDQYKTLIGEENWDENFTVVNNDLFAADVDMTTLKVNSAWSGLDIGEQVADGFYFGFNAFTTAKEALTVANELGDATIDLMEETYSYADPTRPGVKITNAGTYKIINGSGVLLNYDLDVNPDLAEGEYNLSMKDADLTLTKLTLRSNSSLTVTDSRIDYNAYEGGSAYLSVYNNSVLNVSNSTIGFDPHQSDVTEPSLLPAAGTGAMDPYWNWAPTWNIYGTATIENSTLFAYVGQANQAGFDVRGNGTATVTGSELSAALVNVGTDYDSTKLEQGADENNLSATLIFDSTTVKNTQYRGDYNTNNGIDIGQADGSTAGKLVIRNKSDVDFTILDYGDTRQIGLRVNNAKSSVEISDSTVKLPSVTNSGRISLGNASMLLTDTVTNSGAISLDYTSTLAFGDIANSGGEITIDTTGFVSGIYKILDYTGTGTYTKDQYEALLGNHLNDSYTVVNNDLYLTNLDGSEVRYVNSAWSSCDPFEEVTFVDGTRAYYGQNAFDTVDHALALPQDVTSYDKTIRLNVTGEVGAITVVGTNVTEVNVSAKPADLTEDTVIDADAIVVNLVEIDNTNAGWQVYYPLASGSNAQVYGNITTNFLSTTFTWGEKTADPNFIGGAYAGSTATVYGNTTVNLGAVDAADDTLQLDTSFLIGAGAGTVNGNSSVNINSGTIQANAIVGGGAWRGQVKGDSSVTISGGQITVNSTEDSPGRAIIGGSYGNVSYDPDAPGDPAATAGKSSVTITGDAVVSGKVVGGSDQTAVTNSSVEISGEAQVTGNVYGGGNRGGEVKETATVKLVDTATVDGNVYGGGFGTETAKSTVQGSTRVEVSGGTVTGNVYGGGENSSVGNTSVVVDGADVEAGIYGGSLNGDAGDTTVTISNFTRLQPVPGTQSDKIQIVGGGMAEAGKSSTTASTNVTVTDSRIYGDIVAGSSATGTDATATSGKSVVNVSNLEINGYSEGSNIWTGRVFGAGRAQYGGSVVTESTDVTIENMSGYTYDSEGNIIDGSNKGARVYGAGQAYASMSRVEVGETKLRISGDATNISEIYGGGIVSGTEVQEKAAFQIVGKTDVEITGGTVTDVIAGGNNTNWFGRTVIGVDAGDGTYQAAEGEYGIRLVIGGSTKVNEGALVTGGSYVDFAYEYQHIVDGVDTYGRTAEIYGNTYMELTGDSVISTDVFGGSFAYYEQVDFSADVSKLSAPSATQYGDVTVVVSGNTAIAGSVYGGGAVLTNTDQVKTTSVTNGDVSVLISGGAVGGNVYAGGYYADVNGNASVTLSGGTVGGDIYGGSEGSGTVAGSSTLNVGATDAARYTTTLNNVYDFDVANITNAAVTVEGVFSATQISIADSTLTLNSGFDAATTTVSIEVGAYNAENAALVLGSAVGTAPAISISAGSNALTEARYLVATGFDDTTAFSLDESLAGEYILRAVDGNIYLYNADAPYFTTELSVTQAEGASVDGYYSFTANFEAAGLLTGYTLKLYDSATATTPVDEVTLDADVIGQEFTLENTTQSFWISVTANGENGLSTDSPTSGRLEVVVKDYDSPVILSVTSDAKSDSVTLACEATDNFGVTGYEFILDGQSLGVQTGSEIALDLSTLTAGTHSYTVNVYDAAGNLATSAEQSFDFTPEPGPGPEPTEPANFLYSSQVRMNNGETVSVYATYSDAAAALEYRIGDSGKWLTYDATTGVNVSSSTTVYFREQGITDPVETAVDVTVVPADVELNAEVILLAPTTDTTYEVIYNFADGGSKAVELSGNSVEHYALPENTTVTIVEKDASGEVVNTIVEETPAASTTAEIPDKVVAVDDGHDNLFFAMPVGQWGTGIAAQHLGDGTWGGTLEIVSLTGKNRFSTVFTGSNDATTLFLTDDANGDVFFLDDIYTANGSDARIRKMSEIQAGAGDDIVDLTSARFAYEEHASKQLTVRGGDGNDILWGNAGHNIMFGDDGNDRIYGGSDNDVLIGGTGNDTMLGGGGDDIFCYGSSFDWGSDTITQLSGGTVTLYLDGIDRNDCSISGSTLTWNDGTHTGSITLNGVSWDSVKFYCAANGDGDLTKQSDYEELKNKGAFAAISSH